MLTLLSADAHGAKSFYGELCRYVHTNVRAVVSLIVKQPKTRDWGLILGPEFDKEKVDEIAGYPTLVSLMLVKIFRDELTENRKEEITRFIEQYVSEKKLMKKNKT